MLKVLFFLNALRFPKHHHFCLKSLLTSSVYLSVTVDFKVEEEYRALVE